MNTPAGKPRARRAGPRKPVQLNLRRTPVWPEEDELNENPEGHFWRWFAIVAVLHVIAFFILALIFHGRQQPPPQFIALMPPGETVKGTPGTATAPKFAPTLPAPSKQADEPTPPKPKVQKVQPPAPKPPPLLAANAPVPAAPPKPKPKPKPPAPPKVKVDLTLADAPDTDEPPPPKPKPKAHPKKPAHKADREAAASEDTDGLSKQEVAQKLGDQFKDSGVDKADKTGVSGEANGRPSDFSAYKQMIHDRVMNKWSVPNMADSTATEPIVHIHLEASGYVPPDSVSLVHSSGNPAIDQSALEAAREIGQLPEPLPKGFPSDTSISFTLNSP